MANAGGTEVTVCVRKLLEPNPKNDPVFDFVEGELSVRYQAHDHGHPVAKPSHFQAKDFLELCRKIIAAHEEACLAIERLKIKLGTMQAQKGKE